MSVESAKQTVEGKVKEAAGFVKEEFYEHGKTPEDKKKAQEGRDLRRARPGGVLVGRNDHLAQLIEHGELVRREIPARHGGRGCRLAARQLTHAKRRGNRRRRASPQ